MKTKKEKHLYLIKSKKLTPMEEFQITLERIQYGHLQYHGRTSFTYGFVTGAISVTVFYIIFVLLFWPNPG